jgi:hypothetical protein
MDDLTGVIWHVSTRSSGGGGNCVEAGPLADGSGRVAVRDSKDRGGAVILYSRAQWNSFLTGAKNGDFHL